MTNKYTQPYWQYWKSLDPDQKKAVDQIEGPMLLLSGPGSGKTLVISLRIAQILRISQLKAHNILALTFTQSAVTNLKQRLEKIIGSDGALVNVATFHSFASELIENFSYYIWPKALRPINELEKFQIIQQILIKNVSLKEIRPSRSPDFHCANVIKAIARCKQENVSWSSLQKMAKSQIRQLQESQDRLDQNGRDLIMAGRMLELSLVYRQYQIALKEKGLYDYEDVILMAVNALKRNSFIRAVYQEKYQYVLVDEYQDTNNSQNQLVEILVNFFSQPNLLVVGDDKQAIYRFQGASMVNMLKVKKKYPSITTLSTTNNYRSAPEIIGLADYLIAKNKNQLTSYFPNLKTQQKAVKKTSGVIKAYVFKDIYSHYVWLSKTIKQLIHKEGKDYSLAVLCRKNEKVTEINDFLLKQDIATACSVGRDFISEKLIEALCSIMIMVDAKALDKEKIAYAIALLTKGSNLSDWLELSAMEKITFNSIKKTESLNVLNVLEQIAHWHNRKAKISSLQIIEEILAQVISALASKKDNYQDLDLIEIFWREAIGFFRTRPSASLSEFVEYLQLLKKYNVKIEVGHSEEDNNNVYVGTVHSVKGKEYDCVFITDLDERNWKAQKNSEYFTLPSKIIGLKNWREDFLEDERRLLYVAITRAKNRLYLSYHQKDLEEKVLGPSYLFLEISPCLKINTQEEKLVDRKSNLTPFFSPINIQLQEKVFQQKLLDKFLNSRFSYSAYEAYKFCPRQFLMRYLYGFQEKPDINLIYGSLVHRSLELYFKKYIADRKKPSCNYLASCYRKLSSEVTEDLRNEPIIDNGLEVLLKYCQIKSDNWPVPLAAEFSFGKRNVRLGEIMLTGKIDRIESLPNSADRLRFIDYKTTSKVKSRSFIEGKTSVSERNLKNQLVFYALLSRNDRQFFGKPYELVISFIDDEMKFKDEVFTVSEEDIKNLEMEIVEVYNDIKKRITQGDFPILAKTDMIMAVSSAACWINLALYPKRLLIFSY